MAPAPTSDGRDRFCGAKKRQGEGDCHRPAGWGTSHPGIGRCKLHGGSTPDQIKHVNGQKAADAVVTFGLPREIDPQVALLEEVHRTAGHVSWLQAKIAEFETDDELKQLDAAGKFERASVWVELYQSERAHAVKVSKAAIDAGIAERAVRLAEEQGRQLANVLRDVIADLFRLLLAEGLPGDVLVRVQRERVPALVRTRLLEVMEVSG